MPKRVNSQREVSDRAFCTTQEAAQLLGVSLRTVQLWSQSGVLPCWKTSGGHRRIPREAVERMLQEWREAEAQPAGGARQSRSRPLHIMVMDDDADLLRLYRLHMSGWTPAPKVTTVANGLEALIKLGLERPDLLIVDLKMPGMDGFEVLQVLRSIPEMDSLEIIVISALTQKEIDRRGGISSGVKVMAKPVSFAALQKIVESFAMRIGRSGFAAA